MRHRIGNSSKSEGISEPDDGLAGDGGAAKLKNNLCLGGDEVIGFKNAITLYPNPTNSILNIKLRDNQDLEIQEISIVNVLEQIVYSQPKNPRKLMYRF